MLRTIALAVLCLIAAVPSFATAYTWNGSASDLWSNPANWTPNGVPQSGDSLTFPTTSSRRTTTNDLTPGQSLALTIEGLSEYLITGNEIAATSIIGGYRLRMQAPLRLLGDADYVIDQAEGPIDIGPHRLNLSTHSVTGYLSGSGLLHHSWLNNCCGAINGSHGFTGVVSGTVNAAGLSLPGTLAVDSLSGNGSYGATTIAGQISGGPHTTGNFKLNPGAVFWSQGTAPQLHVTGTVDITGASFAHVIGSSSATAGQVWTLIENDGTDPVIGTFEGLPEGAVYDNGPEAYIVSYRGGDGNDVTLTALRSSKGWSGRGGNNLWSNPANWVGGVAPVNGDSLIFPRGDLVENDIPGLTVARIDAGFVYDNLYGLLSPTIRGLAVGVTEGVWDVAAMNAPVVVQADGVVLTSSPNAYYYKFDNVDVGPFTVELRGIVGALNGSGRVRFMGGEITAPGTFSGTLELVQGELYMRSTLPAATVISSGHPISGYGAIGWLGLTGERFTVPRKFDAANPTSGYSMDFTSITLYAGATLEASLGYSTPPVVARHVTLDGGPALQTRLYNVRPAPGDEFVLIRNDGSDAVSGTFGSLPEGATVTTVDGLRFRISYAGGDGNDVTLTALNGYPADGDHDGDGRADLIWYHEGSGRLHRMSIDTDEVTSQETVYIEPNLDWRPVARGDFDGDGVADLLWRNDATGEIYQMRFGRDGRPAEGRVIYREPNPAWQVVGVLRLRSLRQADILWWNRDTGALYLLGMDGFDVVEQGFIAGAPGPEWRYEVAGNFACLGYSRGSDHLVWRNPATGEARMAIASRTTTFFQLLYDSVFHTEPDPAWHIVGAMHTGPFVDSDIYPDALMWWNDQTGELYKMSSPCSQNKGQVYHRPASPEWRPVAFDDYDANGAGDVAWRNEIDGRIYIMLTSQGGAGPGNTIHQEADPAWKVGLQLFWPPLP